MDSNKHIKGCLLGIMLISNAFYYSPKNQLHTKSEWITGPYIYEIEDVIKLKEPIKCKGNQSCWKVPKCITEDIMKTKNINKKLAQWKKQFGDQYVLILF